MEEPHAMAPALLVLVGLVGPVEQALYQTAAAGRWGRIGDRPALQKDQAALPATEQ